MADETAAEQTSNVEAQSAETQPEAPETQSAETPVRGNPVRGVADRRTSGRHQAAPVPSSPAEAGGRLRRLLRPARPRRPRAARKALRRTCVQSSTRGTDEHPRSARCPSRTCRRTAPLIKVEATGVCRSDWHAWQGHEPVPLPHIPGHEFAGGVSAVGAKVKRAKIGDRVTAPFVVRLRSLRLLSARRRAGLSATRASPGSARPGSFADYVVVNAADTNLVPLPKGVPMTAAAALGCRFATAYRALVGHGRIGPGPDRRRVRLRRRRAFGRDDRDRAQGPSDRRRRVSASPRRRSRARRDRDRHGRMHPTRPT